MEYCGKSVTFDRKAVLGKGATAVVFSGHGATKMSLSIKRGELPKFNVREENTMKAIGHHENVIDCFGILKDCDFIYIILELCDATVEQYCQGIYKGIVPPDYQALYQMADGLHFIHSKNLAHRDVSTSNVLIKFTGDKVVLKIADFGVFLEICDATVEDFRRGEYKGKVPSDRSALFQMADELDHVHSKGFAHRNISSNNVLIKLTGDEAVMKISDFGVCKPASETKSFSMSDDGC
ncbi:hypothetical protein DAPPUDRAFT_318376 [Daphnia pulex]|uniref:Protein kinase domain-containing protein n=1 Tax=Daphnia pulex TaxID=6669 RepID=E9GIL7_DAPPU|nr:hypothetical protein DAPPUDRAFT_318376 [Daphnia pulex]|eukprot:EFX80730.1 hypothetical protein DAPPUDRAFT_318376 [Daphnia pulex]